MKIVNALFLMTLFAINIASTKAMALSATISPLAGSDNPVLEDFQLSDGTIVKKPFLFWDSKSVWIVGLIDPKLATEILSPYNRKPFIHPQSQMAMATLTVFNFGKSYAGTITAITLTIFAEDKTFCQDTVCKPAGLFWKYYTTSVLAKNYGIELWGVPKELADNNLSVKSDQIQIVSKENGKVALEVNLRNTSVLGSTTAVTEGIVGFTPNTYKSTTFISFFKGTKYPTQPMNPQSDSVKFDSSTGLGSELKRLGFTAVAWDFYPDFSGVSHSPIEK